MTLFYMLFAVMLNLFQHLVVIVSVAVVFCCHAELDSASHCYKTRRDSKSSLE